MSIISIIFTYLLQQQSDASLPPLNYIECPPVISFLLLLESLLKNVDVN